MNGGDAGPEEAFAGGVASDGRLPLFELEVGGVLGLDDELDMLLPRLSVQRNNNHISCRNLQRIELQHIRMGIGGANDQT